ncbi:MAG: universal stress protein [Candidatus Binatia bacterium]
MRRSKLPAAWLVAVDFSPASLRALDATLDWAPPEADITVVHVVDTDLALRVDAAGGASATDAIARMRSRAERELALLADSRRGRRFETMLVEGAPFAEIGKIASDLACDVIVIGARGTSPQDFLFGSTAEKVLRSARQPVLCIP